MNKEKLFNIIYSDLSYNDKKNKLENICNIHPHCVNCLLFPAIRYRYDADCVSPAGIEAVNQYYLDEYRETILNKLTDK